MFDRAVDLVISLEGGFVDHPRDPGGATKYGISQRAFPAVAIINITIAQAKEHYKNSYWDKMACDKLPHGLDMMVFDMAVNHGVDTAASILQKILNVTPDGVIGSATLAALQGKRVPELIEMVALERHRYYISSKNWDVFGRGWSKRLLIVALMSAFYCKSGV